MYVPSYYYDIYIKYRYIYNYYIIYRYVKMAYADRVEFCKTVINNLFNRTIIII